MNDHRNILQRIAADVQIGRGTNSYDFVNLYGCTIGEETKSGRSLRSKEMSP